MDYSNEFPDCLVLKIEEYDATKKKLDASVFIFFDTKDFKYIVRGQRSTEEMESCTFSFSCEHEQELLNFIRFIVCKKNLWTYILYNYDNLPLKSNQITYEFLKEHENKKYELSGYNKQKYSFENLQRNIRMVKNVFNYYN